MHLSSSLHIALLCIGVAIPGFAQGQTSDQTREPVIHIAQAANALELEFWNSVKNSTDAGDFEAYLEAFPDGIFAPLAKIRVELYSESPATTAAPSGPDIEEIESLYDVLATSNLRQEPTAKSKRVGQLRAGTQVLVTGKVVGRNWYRVEAADGSSAYIYGDLVAKVKLRGEQEVAQQAASDDAARKAEEQAAAKKAVEEAARQAAAAEAARLAAEKKAAEEAKRLAAEKKAAEEAKRLAAEKKAAEEAAKRLAAAEKSASAARRRAEAAQTALAELQKQQAAEAQNRATAQKAAEEAERRAAAKAAADAAKRRAAAEAAVEEAERLVTTARETEADLRRAGTRKAAEEVERLAAARKALADAQRRVEALKSQLATLQENQASATKERTVTQEAAREALRQAQAEKTDAETARQAELDQANAAAAQLAAEHKAAAESRKQAEEERRVEAANRLAAAQKAAEEAVREAKAREAEVEKLQGQQAPKPDEAKKATEDLLDQAAARQAAPAAERPAATQNSGSESLRRPSAVQVAETEKTRQLAGGIARPALKRPAPLAEGFKDCRDCPEMIELAPGSFAMGSAFDASEQPVHTVRIDYRFAIGKHEITHGNWKACVDDGGCASLPGLRDNARKPARNISWDDTQQYLTWLRQKTERPYRLPTESEWEYAARANNKASFWWGDQPKAEHANCKGCGGAYDRKSPAEVGLFPPNPFGLHDMNGSVWEWVADCWQGSYDGHPTDGSSWQEEDCQTRVLRGGSWRNDISYARSASRFYYDADVRYSVNGFRVALTLQ